MVKAFLRLLLSFELRKKSIRRADGKRHQIKMALYYFFLLLFFSGIKGMRFN